MGEGRNAVAIASASLLVLTLALSGCSKTGPRGTGALAEAMRDARDSQSLSGGDNADAVVRRFIPPGSAVGPALELLVASGFEVRPMVNGRPKSYVGDAAFLATQSGPSHDLCEEEWRILLDSRSGRISKLDAHIFQHCS